MKKVILFDIDFTLFDARLYREAFVSKLQEKMGYKEDSFALMAEEAYRESKQTVGYFDPTVFLDKLQDRTHTHHEKQALLRIILDQNLISSYLYADVNSILEKISRQNDIIIGIFSAGKISLQRPKIEKVKHFFDKEHIHIFEFHKGHALPELIKSYKSYDIYIIDDIQSILVEAKKLRSDITTIWIQRQGYTRDTKLVAHSAPDYIIKSLEEIIPII